MGVFNDQFSDNRQNMLFSWKKTFNPNLKKKQLLNFSVKMIISGKPNSDFRMKVSLLFINKLDLNMFSLEKNVTWNV